jgi:hypothetical protein
MDGNLNCTGRIGGASSACVLSLFMESLSSNDGMESEDWLARTTVEGKKRRKVEMSVSKAVHSVMRPRLGVAVRLGSDLELR